MIVGIYMTKIMLAPLNTGFRNAQNDTSISYNSFTWEKCLCPDNFFQAFKFRAHNHVSDVYFTYFLFIYEANSTSHYVAWNVRMITEKMNWKECVKKV
jgi:hypothetical protein